MNTTLEKEVCANFLKLNNENDVSDYPRLNPEAVQSISKSVTKLIYDSIQNENQNTKQNRDAIVNLISKWSKPIQYEHVRINDNRDDFIKSLNSIKRDSDVFDEFRKKILEENLDINIWDEMIKTFDERNKIQVENKTSIDLVKALDNLHLNKSGFDCNIPRKIVQKNNIDNSLAFLKGLSKQDDLKKDTPEFDASKPILYQRDSNPSVGLGYGLLNMENNIENNLLLLKIVNEILMKNEMDEIEINFIKYIWTNRDKLNIEPIVYEIILNKCSFLYEIPILKLATSVLLQMEDEQQNSEDYVSMILSSDMRKFLDKITTNDKSYYNILSCFHELFVISNYDRRLLRLLDNFKMLMDSN